MSKMVLIYVLFMSSLLLFLTGCNKVKEVIEEKAMEIALSDISDRKHGHTDFTIYDVERKNMNDRNTDNVYDSWVVIIRSMGEDGEDFTLYQINALNGRIIDITNYAE
ncbi:hypothetical protein SAMN05421736_101352 [Evansella caseinilytica]|uniref:PepSY domain-containing protein n=1 Tax=Evansella caseinilytica TaxID=1503961 RepID=A0A1H3H3H1_9BACI|nr:hypothetical protein [Evansella caseinilytica]SDY09458.1 hypothetical protein SAMN05421736_101352 [Evansella caseinilytica]